MSDRDYRAAYERQKKARIQAEELLEAKSRELYESNVVLQSALDKLKEQKAQLLHQEKLASVGQLAAGVAHEINNPTGFVKSNLGTLKRYVDQIQGVLSAYSEATDTLNKRYGTQEEAIFKSLSSTLEENDLNYVMEDILDLLDESMEGTSRIQAIVQSLKLFSRPEGDGEEYFSINDCIQSTLKLVSGELKHKCELIVQLEEVPDVKGFPGSFGQVLVNLFTNAIQSMDDFGKLSVSTSHVQDDVVIKVSDTGSGIEIKHLNKIFDPFFTTKDVGVGTGLGLSISHGIIKKHGGKIDVESRVGEGSTFILTIPAAKEEE